MARLVHCLIAPVPKELDIPEPEIFYAAAESPPGDLEELLLPMLESGRLILDICRLRSRNETTIGISRSRLRTQLGNRSNPRTRHCVILVGSALHRRAAGAWTPTRSAVARNGVGGRRKLHQEAFFLVTNGAGSLRLHRDSEPFQSTAYRSPACERQAHWRPTKPCRDHPASEADPKLYPSHPLCNCPSVMLIVHALIGC
jgi:hypothetical protein